MNKCEKYFALCDSLQMKNFITKVTFTTEKENINYLKYLFILVSNFYIITLA